MSIQAAPQCFAEHTLRECAQQARRLWPITPVIGHGGGRASAAGAGVLPRLSEAMPERILEYASTSPALPKKATSTCRTSITARQPSSSSLKSNSPYGIAQGGLLEPNRGTTPFPKIHRGSRQKGVHEGRCRDKGDDMVHRGRAWVRRFESGLAQSHEGISGTGSPHQ